MPMRCLLWGLIGLWAAAPAIGAGGLPDHVNEVGLLVAPTVAHSSAASGLFNPAAWWVPGTAKVHFSWRDRVCAREDPKDWTAAVAGGRVAFGMQRFQHRGAEGRWHHLDEYTIGLTGGQPGSHTGISYTWNRGSRNQMARHRRMAVGMTRWGRALGVGSVAVIDLEKKDHYVAADVALETWNSRLTFFVDTVYRYGDQWDDLTGAVGLSLVPAKGIAVAARVREGGACGIRVQLDLADGYRPSVRMYFDDDQEHWATVYAIER